MRGHAGGTTRRHGRLLSRAVLRSESCDLQAQRLMNDEPGVKKPRDCTCN
jgi:hypothetical protein